MYLIVMIFLSFVLEKTGWGSWEFEHLFPLGLFHWWSFFQWKNGDSLVKKKFFKFFKQFDYFKSWEFFHKFIFWIYLF